MKRSDGYVGCWALYFALCNVSLCFVVHMLLFSMVHVAIMLIYGSTGSTGECRPLRGVCTGYRERMHGCGFARGRVLFGQLCRCTRFIRVKPRLLAGWWCNVLIYWT